MSTHQTRCANNLTELESFQSGVRILLILTTFRNKKPPINLYFPETALNFTQNRPGPVEYTWEENPAEYFQYTRKIFLNRRTKLRRDLNVLKWGSYFAYFNHFPKQKNPP